MAARIKSVVSLSGKQLVWFPLVGASPGVRVLFLEGAMVNIDLYIDRIQHSFLMKMLIDASSALTCLEVSVNQQFALHCCLPFLVIIRTLKWRSFGIPPLIKVVNTQKDSVPAVLFGSPIMHSISCTFNEKSPNFHSTYCSWNGPSQELTLACYNNR